ncbi:mechanosensitive ion channel family protein [Mucilaginibacter robiniae]|uniref:Mechanosensitive ion channel family protein n=1 Tax=Mucilaginibacter robiniae TaxID=2728022 RepID=A0A7L5E0B7_9SPHI|nr:mechanosensitive ion channel family protein [Mucilaginibacter robiniae]QJD96820.1 mechanosensitive ion channel family protein [Mucilaginibacter robiniae]
MRIFVILFTFIFSTCAAFAQQDSLLHKEDSVVDTRLDHQLNRIRQLSAERLADSLKREDLQRQAAQLSSADNIRKSALLKELISLKQRDSLQRIRQQHQVDSLKHFVKGFPVKLFHQTLFQVFTRQGSFTASDRAQAVQNRIDKIADDYTFQPDSLILIAAEQTTDIQYKDRLLISVSEQDALWQNLTREKLAIQYRDAIRNAIKKYQQETRWQTLLAEGLKALLIIALVIVLIYGVNRLFKWLLAKLRLNTRGLIKGIHIKSYELLNTEQQFQIVDNILKLIRWTVNLLIISLALFTIFSIFPFTKDISVALLGYIALPLKRIGLAVWSYIPDLITILVIVVIFRYVLRFFNYIKVEIAKGRLTIPGFYPDWANPTYQILRVLIFAFMLIVIFPYLPGSDTPIFKGVSVFVGVLFTFGSAGALNNLVAGLVLTYMRAFKLGDRVKINEVTGDIVEKTLLVTRIRTIQNEIISIPNSMVMGSYTVNYSSEASTNGLIINTTVTIGYDVPWRQVHQLLIEAALATPIIEPEPTPYVLQTSLDDYYVSYRINAFVKQPNKQAVIYSALHQNIQDKFNEAGIEIMSPHYRAVRDGSIPAMPSEYPPENEMTSPAQPKQS